MGKKHTKNADRIGQKVSELLVTEHTYIKDRSHRSTAPHGNGALPAEGSGEFDLKAQRQVDKIAWYRHDKAMRIAYLRWMKWVSDSRVVHDAGLTLVSYTQGDARDSHDKRSNCVYALGAYYAKTDIVYTVHYSRLECTHCGKRFDTGSNIRSHACSYNGMGLLGGRKFSIATRYEHPQSTVRIAMKNKSGQNLYKFACGGDFRTIELESEFTIKAGEILACDGFCDAYGNAMAYDSVLVHTPACDVDPVLVRTDQFNTESDWIDPNMGTFGKQDGVDYSKYAGGRVAGTFAGSFEGISEAEKIGK